MTARGPNLVVLYVLPGCRRCRGIREYLASARVPHQVVNALIHPKLLLKLTHGFRLTFPLATLDGRVIHAVTVGRLRRALGSPRRRR